jgi:predicted ATPase with chaperone activity
MVGSRPAGSTRARATSDDLGIRRSLLEGLALKTLHQLGEASLDELARHMRVSLSAAEGIFQRLRKDQLCQATGMQVAGIPHLSPTSAGRTRATELLGQSQYVGPAPVSLDDYVARVRAQSVLDVAVGARDLTAALGDLVLDEEMVARLGTAMASGRAVFLYGPPGTGKTTVGERLARVFARDRVWVPHAVEVDGQIIAVYDEGVHRRVDDATLAGDARWVQCERPRVLAGGELTIEMLDLQFDPSTGYHAAPIQMQANNGLLIVDDFGRQRIRPEDLLNRWVVPLDRRIDFLTLAGGKKIQVPFDLVVIFATNLDPGRVVDEAFLRRIHTKIKLDHITSAQFHEIFRRTCADVGLDYDRAIVDGLVETITGTLGETLRSCQPGDIIQQICWRARYESRPPTLDRETVTAACRNYFVGFDTEGTPGTPPAESNANGAAPGAEA